MKTKKQMDFRQKFCFNIMSTQIQHQLYSWKITTKWDTINIENVIYKLYIHYINSYYYKRYASLHCTYSLAEGKNKMVPAPFDAYFVKAKPPNWLVSMLFVEYFF